MLLCMRISLTWPRWFVAVLSLLALVAACDGAPGQALEDEQALGAELAPTGDAVAEVVQSQDVQEPAYCGPEQVSAMVGGYAVEVLSSAGCESAPVPVSVSLLGRGMASVYYTHAVGDTEAVATWAEGSGGAYLESAVVMGWHHEPGLAFQVGHVATWAMDRYEGAPCVRTVRLYR